MMQAPNLLGLKRQPATLTPESKAGPAFLVGRFLKNRIRNNFFIFVEKIIFLEQVRESCSDFLCLF